MEITTNTIAELYIKQGYPEKAIDIYNAILEIDPANATATEKLAHLKVEISGGGVSDAESIDGPVAAVNETVAAVVSETVPETVTTDISGASPGSDPASQIVRLEGWLTKIETMRGHA